MRTLDEKIAQLDQELAYLVRKDAQAKRLMTVPGIGPITATALIALAPAAQGVARSNAAAALDRRKAEAW